MYGPMACLCIPWASLALTPMTAVYPIRTVVYLPLPQIPPFPCSFPAVSSLSPVFTSLYGSSVAEWLARWTQAQKDLGSNRSRDAVG